MGNTNNRNALVFMPDWSSSNSYQKLMYSAVSASGIPCHGLNGKDFTLLWLWRNKKRYKYLHLHWLFGMYDPGNSRLTRMKALLFLFRLMVARSLGYKLLWTVHNFISHESPNIAREMLLKRITAHLVNHIIVHCHFAKRMILDSLKINEHKVSIMPHGSYRGYYPNNVSRTEARHKIGISDDGFTFLFFGFLREYKGINYLLKCFKEIKLTLPSLQLVIAGKPLRETIKREIEELAAQDGVFLHLRFIPDDEVQYFFNASDVVVLPYLNILTSGGVLLAMSFGKPVIVPAKGCIPELVDASTGFLYRHAKELSEAMREAAISEDIVGMGMRAMACADALAWSDIVNTHYLPLIIRR